MDNIYSEEYIKDFILKRNTTMKNFIRNHRSIYRTAQKMGIWNNVKNLFNPSRKNKYSVEEIITEARKYKTRYQFQLNNIKMYVAAVQYDILDEACSHMLPVNFSIPQMICRDIFDSILGIKCVYDDCTVIRPYELDMYYPTFNLAVEYDGFFHHDPRRKEFNDNVARDSYKDQLCLEKGIHLIRIKQTSTSKNYNLVEVDIKNQIKNKLSFLNTSTGRNISELTVDAVKIDINRYYDIYDLDAIKELSKSCFNIMEFIQKHKNLYNILRKVKRLDILDHLRGKKDHWKWASKTDDEIIEYLTTSFFNVKDIFRDEKLRRMLSRRKLRNKIIEHFNNIQIS